MNQLGLGFTFSAKDMASGAIANVGKSLAGLDVSSAEVSEHLEQAGEGMKNAGLAAAGLGTAVIAGLGYATAKAYEFDKAMSLVSTRVDTSKMPMAELDELVDKLGAHFGLMPTDEAKALYEAIGQGARDAESATAVMTAANQLAKGTATDLGTTMSSVTEAVKAFGLNMRDAGQAADALFVASKDSGLTVGELGSSLERFAPLASAAGLSMQETLAMLGGLSKAGVSGRAVMTSMQGILQALIQPSKEASQEAARLGIQFNAQAVKSKGLLGVLSSITSNTHLTKESMTKLFGSVEAVTSVMAVMKNGGVALSGAMQDMAHSAGAAGDAAAKMTKESERFAALKDEVWTKLGKDLEPVVEKILSFVNVFLEGFMAIPQPIIAVGVTLAAVAGGILFLSGTITALIGVAIALDSALFPLVVGMAALSLVMAGVAAGIGVIAGGLTLIGIGFKQAFDQNLGGVATTFKEAYDKIRLVWDGLKQLFTDGGFSGDVLKELDKAKNQGLQHFVIEVFLWFNRFKNFFDGIKTGFADGIKALTPVFQGLSDAFHRLGEALGFAMGGENDPDKNAAKFKAFGDAGEKAGRMFSTLVGWAARAITWIADVATEVATSFGSSDPDSAGSIFGTLKDTVVELFGSFGDLADAISGVSNGFNHGQGGAKGFANTLLGAIKTGMTWTIGLLHFMHGMIELVADKLQMAIVAWDAFKGAAMAALGPIIPLVEAVAKGLGFVVDLGGGKTGTPGSVGNPVGKMGHTSLGFGPRDENHDKSSVWKPQEVLNRSLTEVALASSSDHGPGADHRNAERLHMLLQQLGPVLQRMNEAHGNEKGDHIIVTLDGTKIADALKKKSSSDTARNFAPQPIPG